MPETSRLLVVDDEKPTREGLRAALVSREIRIELPASAARVEP